MYKQWQSLSQPVVMCAKWAICVLRARHWIIHATKINATLSALLGGRDGLSFFGIDGVGQIKTSAASRLLQRTKKLLFCDSDPMAHFFCLLRVPPFRPRQPCKNRFDWRRLAGNHVRCWDSVFISMPMEWMQNNALYGDALLAGIHSRWCKIVMFIVNVLVAHAQQSFWCCVARLFQCVLCEADFSSCAGE
jgi:hypothetical protein